MKTQLPKSLRETRVTFICGGTSYGFDWNSIERPQEPLVHLDNPFHALQLLTDQGHHYGWEVSRIIIDQDVAELGFLEFLARLPHTFRGDVLFIATPQRAFLSAVGRYDDRVLYALTRADVDFYLETMVVEGPRPETESRHQSLEIAC